MLLLRNLILVDALVLQISAPMVDLEVRGVPALQYFSNVVWSDAYDSMNTGACTCVWGPEQLAEIRAEF